MGFGSIQSPNTSPVSPNYTYQEVLKWTGWTSITAGGVSAMILNTTQGSYRALSDVIWQLRKAADRLLNQSTTSSLNRATEPSLYKYGRN